jgi:hypothetical protein
MEIITPQGQFLDCHCRCGAHFLATQKDIKVRRELVKDPFYTSMYSPGSGADQQDLKIIECPFCSGFAILNRDIDIDTAIINKESDSITEKNIELYDDSEEKRSHYVTIKIIDWEDSPYLREKYKRSIELNEL